MNLTRNKQRAVRILWPAFLAAGALEIALFAVIDPRDLRWFGGAPVGRSAETIYSVTFVIFCTVIAAASALTTLLSLGAVELIHAARSD